MEEFHSPAILVKTQIKTAEAAGCVNMSTVDGECAYTVCHLIFCGLSFTDFPYLSIFHFKFAFSGYYILHCTILQMKRLQMANEPQIHKF